MNLDILKAPTPPEEIQWRVRSVTKDGTRCSVIAYVDSRYMQARLNEAFGVGNWSVEYPDPPIMWTRKIKDRDNKEREVDILALKCKLTVYSEDEDRTAIHEDYGYVNGPDDDEPLKSAASDGLKRCCVHFGLTHDIYAMEARWVNYDAQNKRPVMDGQPSPQPIRPPSPSSQPTSPTETKWPSWAPKTCPSCGAGTVLREGIKDGKPWAGAMCDGPKRPGQQYKGCGADPTWRPSDWHETQAVQESLTPEDQARVEEAAARGAEVDAIRECWGHRGYLIPPAQAGSLHKWLTQDGLPVKPLPESCTAKVVDGILSAMSLDMLSRYRAAQETKRDAEVDERESETDPFAE